VSQHVAALEASLGVRLFDRRPFALTPAARRLAEHAGSILLRVDVATSELAALDRPPTVAVHSTAFPATTALVAGLATRATDVEGAARGELVVAGGAAVVAAVAQRACALGVVDGIVGPHDPLALADPGLLTALVLATSPLSVAMPSDHPLARRRHLAWPAVADARWIDAPGLVPPTGPGAAALLERRAARTRYQGCEPSVLGALVGAGHGLALVPAWWRPPHGVTLVALTDPPWVHRVEVLVLRSRASAWAPIVTALRDQ
jgi:DNA-binding transcriptional LysR family regulator